MDRIPGETFGQGTQEQNLMASLMAAARNTPRGNARLPPTPQALQNQIMLDMLIAANEGTQASIAPRCPSQNAEPERGNASAMRTGGQPPALKAIQNQLMLEMLMATSNVGQNPVALDPLQNAEPARDNALRTDLPRSPQAMGNGVQQSLLPRELTLQNQLMLEMLMAAGNGGGGRAPNTQSKPARGDPQRHPHPIIRNGGQQPPIEQALQNQLMLEMGSVGGGQTLVTPRPAQNSRPRTASLPLGPAVLDNPLVIPQKDMPLPSMENMQLRDIQTPHPHDVLCGRGGGTNNHIGNEKFRALVQAQKVRYLKSSKREKLQVSRDIVRVVRVQEPPGRFLNRDESSDGRYYEIGNRKAREKTSQALREGAPGIRSKIHKPSDPSPRVPTGPQPLLPRPFHTKQQVGHGNPVSARSTLLNHHSSVEQQIAMGMQAASHFLSGKPADYNIQRARAAQIATAMAAVGSPANSQMAAAMAAVGAPPNAQMAAAMATVGASASALGMANQDAFAGLKGGRSQMLAACNPESDVSPEAISASPFGRGFGAGNSQVLGLQSPRIGRGSGLSPFLTSGASDATSQSHAMRRLGLDPGLFMNRTAAGGNTASLAAPAGPKKSIARTAKPSLSPLSDDLAHRLVLAETMAQRTLNGSVTEELKAEEKRMDLYLDAGLLGIDLNEMSERIAKGETEESIVQDGFTLLKLKGRQPSEKRGGAKLATPTKRRKLAAAPVKGGSTCQDKAIQDALVAIGAATLKE